MEIDYSTRNLVVLNYPEGGGGKFISLALALNPGVLIQEEKMARLMMREDADTSMGFLLAMKAFEKSEKGNKHFEFGCGQLAGFNAQMLVENPNADNDNCNDLWRQLTNQKDFYYFMIDHTERNLLAKYKNRKTIRLVNYDWIMEARQWKVKKLLHAVDGEEFIFDMNTIKDEKDFLSETKRAIGFLNLSNADSEFDARLEIIRKKFLETFKIGFNKGGMNEGR